MRQRILIAIALILLAVFAYTVLSKSGRGSARLIPVSLPSASWTFTFHSLSEISTEIPEPQVQVRDIESRVEFKGRTSKSRYGFENLVNYASTKLRVDGVPQRLDAMPKMYFEAPRDNRGRPVFQGYADLYPFEVLNTAMFFPFLSGQRSEPGDTWQDQFRIVLPWGDQQMIVVMNTRLIDIKSTRECVIEFDARGEALYVIDRDQNPRTPSTKEKAVLMLSGESLFDPVVTLPLQLKQELILETFDYERLRRLGQAMSPGLGRLSRLRSTISLEVVERGIESSVEKKSEVKQTPESIENLEPEMQ